MTFSFQENAAASLPSRGVALLLAAAHAGFESAGKLCDGSILQWARTVSNRSSPHTSSSRNKNTASLPCLKRVINSARDETEIEGRRGGVKERQRDVDREQGGRGI